MRHTALVAALIGGLAAAAPASAQRTETAIFAGGCFWCVESDFDKIKGVVSTTSGYIGGRTKNPTYKQVSAGGTGHAEVVRIVFDPRQVSYDKLLAHFFRTTDPFTGGGQFCDRGDQYRNAVFYTDARQLQAVRKAKAELNKRFAGRVATTIEKATAFYPAEGYHQDHYKKNPTKYKFYRWNCGRDQRVKQVWGKEAYGF